MDGDIRAAQQLEAELHQSVYRLTRKIQLYQLQTDALRETRTSLEKEESDLLLQLNNLREVEAVHKREVAAIRENLAAKSSAFSETTKRASELLVNVALQRENSVLQTRIGDLMKQVEKLRLETDDYPDIDDAKISSQLATVHDLRRKHEETVARQQRTEALVLRALEAAAGVRDNQDEDDEAMSDTRKLEEALESMSQLIVERLAAIGATSAPLEEERGECSQTQLELLLTRLSVERDRERAMFNILAGSLAERIRRNRELSSACEGETQPETQLCTEPHGCDDGTASDRAQGSA